METKKRTKREISKEIRQINTKIGKLGMEIGQDSHTNDDSLKRSLDIMVQELGELQERNKQLNKELEEATE